jgi:integrase/recombinase XerD
MVEIDRIFDTRVDTRKMFVSVKTKFILRKYVDKEQLSPLYLYVTGNNQRERINLDLRVPQKYWCATSKRLKHPENKFTDTNLILDNIQSKITAIFVTYRLSNKHLDVTTFTREFISGIPRVDFISFAEHFLKEERGQIAAGTYKRHMSVLSKLRQWRKQIFFTAIDYQFIISLRKRLFDIGNQSTTIEANIASVKKFLNAAKKLGIQFALDPNDIKIGNTHGNKVDLKQAEVKRLLSYYNSEFINDTHLLVLGYFLFGCFNGNRISEIQSIDKIEFEGSWFEYYEMKKDRMKRRNINQTTRKILERNPNLFVTKLTDQYLNREIKKIAKLCGINKKISFHTARHTFATNFLRMGGDVVSLKELLGHYSINQTMVYVHMVESEINEKVFIIDKLLY